MVELDGVPVPLSKCDWVMRRPCGCYCGVLVAYMHEEGEPIATEDQAWKDFEPRKKGRDKRKAAGYTLALVTHDDYVNRICPVFLKECDKCRKPKQSALPVSP